MGDNCRRPGTPAMHKYVARINFCGTPLSYGAHTHTDDTHTILAHTFIHTHTRTRKHMPLLLLHVRGANALVRVVSSPYNHLLIMRLKTCWAECVHLITRKRNGVCVFECKCVCVCVGIHNGEVPEATHPRCLCFWCVYVL